MIFPCSVSTHPHAHLHQPMLPCNKLHDHRHTHRDKVSSIKQPNKYNDKCNISRF